MISNPKYGWCDFELGGFKGTPSYLTDVPVDLLVGFIDYFTKGSSCIWFDEEGTEFTLLLTPYSMFIVIEKDEHASLYDLSEINIKELAAELIRDIEFNIDEWSGWIIGDEEKKAEDIKIHKNELSKLIGELKELL